MPEVTTPESRRSPAVWPSLAMVVAGSLMIVLWPIFTTLHGPTSVNEDGHLLGMDALFWGAMMEGPAGLLIALGLAGSYRLLTDEAGRMARVGFALCMIGLVLPALVNLAIRAVMPPLLAPLLGIGLILLAVGARSSAAGRGNRSLLFGLGAIQLFAGSWFVVVRPDLLDRIYGYRIYGAVATVLFGLGWIVFGFSLMGHRKREMAPQPALAASSGS